MLHLDTDRDDWRHFAQVTGIQGIAEYAAPKSLYKFSCEEVGLTCDPYKGELETSYYHYMVILMVLYIYPLSHSQYHIFYI